MPNIGTMLCRHDPILAPGAGVITSFGNGVRKSRTSGSIAAGSIQRLKAVRWGIATNIVWAWIITIPAAAAIAIVAYFALSLLRL